MEEIMPDINWNEIGEMLKSAFTYARDPAAKEAIKITVKESLDGIKNLFRKKHGNNEDLNEALQELEANPGSKIIKNALINELESEKIEKDAEIVALFRVLVENLAKTPHGDTYNAQTIIQGNQKVTIIKGNQIINEGPGELTKNNDNLRQRYLRDLAAKTSTLPLAYVDPDYADPERGQTLRLVDIYTALDTTEHERMETEDEARDFLKHQEETKRISVQELVNKRKKLVLLGDPGSGKSTFVNYLTLIMSKAGDSDESSGEWLEKLENSGGWDHDILLPVRIILRDFADTFDVDSKKDNAEILQSYIRESFKNAGVDDFWNEFHDGLQKPEKEYLVLLDGLDEVPAKKHKRMVQIINDFSRKYPDHRYLVTCRIYAYVGSDVQLNDFHQATLTSFSEEQIKNFISAWYKELELQKRFTEERSSELAEGLKKAALRPDLRGLSERPLLLTTMALLHSFEGQLPEDRIELYKWTVDLLLRRWQSKITTEKGIVDLLEVEGLKMSDLQDGLNTIAYTAHSKSDDSNELSDIGEELIRKCLLPHLDDSFDKAKIFLNYISKRAGLLIPYKTDTYTFPHRTFQEFLAACHLVGLGDYPTKSVELLKKDIVRWRVVFVLAAGYAPRGQGIAAITLLCRKSVNEKKDKNSKDFELAIIAGEALLEMGLKKVSLDDPGRDLSDCIKGWLLAAIQADEILKPQERVAAGNILSKLGDPRFDPDNFYLPVDENLGFVKIPAGEFQMGSDKEKDSEAFDWELPQHPVTVPEFWISRYPVTVGQFRQFLKDSKHEMDKDWNNFNTIDNHPVVKVSWEDAQSFCAWLILKSGDKGSKIRLPSEAEWEYTIRKDGDTIYPWGDEADSNKMNYRETGIGTISPVGCFPGGSTTDEIEDMNGNVWEWCEDDWHGSYEGAPDEGSAWSDEPRGSSRVLRGGGWGDLAGPCRSAYRYYGAPSIHFSIIGFRLVREGP
ncbi:MAG: SUMF1/EgtB/PvdO family nonheme iron enzyme [Candidatus Electryonea clarkiae]|nr:SUMF1/EgtB/PvdO family nonheme iron enzyme [Candidatus Electryonea clarkiae]MDP8289084.1 SUMF1/EgtB/PvdO family nonheme iron enzyme [Candidatus Electryonea clarkiae]